MKLYSLVTPSHEVLEREWFLPTLPASFSLHMTRLDMAGAAWGSAGFSGVMRRKAETIRDAVAASQGEVIAWSDVDIQFFGDPVPLIAQAMMGRDMVFQRDHPVKRLACAGFFACRATPRTLLFWQAVARLGVPFLAYDDQRMVNLLLRVPGLRWGFLPPVFYSEGAQTGVRWEPGQGLTLPAGMVMHHANWTVGLEAKCAQLRQVRALYEVNHL